MIFQRRLDDFRRELVKAQSEIGQELQAEKGRKRGDLTHKVHEILQMLTPAFAFMFQAGQDVVVDRFFKKKTGGIFLDGGAMTALSALTLCF